MCGGCFKEPSLLRSCKSRVWDCGSLRISWIWDLGAWGLRFGFCSGQECGTYGLEYIWRFGVSTTCTFYLLSKLVISPLRLPPGQNPDDYLVKVKGLGLRIYGLWLCFPRTSK